MGNDSRPGNESRTTKAKTPASGARVFFVSLSLSVGAGRFELPTFRTRTERATKLRYAPEGGGGQWSEGFDLSRMRRRSEAIFCSASGATVPRFLSAGPFGSASL